MTSSVSWYATTTVQVRPGPQPRPLVKPEVRFSRIRLTDDHSATGIRRELTAWFLQVDQPLSLQGPIQQRAAELPTAPLAPRPQKLTKSSLALRPSFHRNRDTFRGKPDSGLNPSSVEELLLKRDSLS